MLFALLIQASHEHRKWGAREEINYHSIGFLGDTACIEFLVVSIELFLSLRSSARAHRKFESISEIFVTGQPLLDVNRRSAAIHALVVRSETISR